MAFSLRLSPYLEAEARQRAELLGISLNSLISVALDLHLRSSRVLADNVPQPAPSVPAPVQVVMPESRPVVVKNHQSVNQVVKVPSESLPVQSKSTPVAVVNSSPAAAPNSLVEKYLREQSVFSSDPKPVLPPNPTKRDRQLLAQWHLRNPKKKE